MTIKMSFWAAIMASGLGALTTGCYAETGYVVTNDAYTYDYAEPTLVAAGPDVYVVSGQPSVYYADNTYWTYSRNNWYRSSYSNGGWVAVNAAPVVVVNHYHRANVAYYNPTPRVPARPHIARQPAHPRVHVAHSPAGKARVRFPVSKPAPAVRSGASVRVHAKPSIRVGGNAHSSHSSPSHSRSRGR